MGLGVCLTREERNLLATAYERKLAPLRAAYRTSKAAADDHARELARRNHRTAEAAEQGSIVRPWATAYACVRACCYPLCSPRAHAHNT